MSVDMLYFVLFSCYFKLVTSCVSCVIDAGCPMCTILSSIQHSAVFRPNCMHSLRKMQATAADRVTWSVRLCLCVFWSRS